MGFFKLRSKINAAILLSCILIALIYGIVLYVFELHRYENSLNKVKLLITVTVNQNHDDLAKEISYNLKDALNITLNNMMKIEGVIGAGAYDREGKLIQASGHYSAPPFLFQKNQNIVSPLFIKKTGQDKIKLFICTAPLKIIGEYVGYIRISYKLNDIERETSFAFTLFIILLIAILLLVFIVLDFMLVHFVINPVSILSNTMKKIHKNGSYERVLLKSQDEIGEMAGAFNDMSQRLEATLNELRAAKDEAESANRSKSEFLAKMSHEIRTPMNAIIGLTHLAMQTEMTVRQRDYLNKIQSSSHVLLGVINDILDFSKIEAGKLEIEFTEFNLEEVLDTLSHLVKIQAEEKEIEFLFSIDEDVPSILIGDPLRLGQILINLTSNALKFTKSGEIIIQIQTLEEPGLSSDMIKLLFSVKDTGIGIPPERITRLFKEFSQAEGSITRKYGGTGLGLIICKRLVEMMNGSISAESVEGQGSIFSFTAEFGRYEKKELTRLVLPQDIRGMRVLVADDNESSRKILKDMLSSFSFEVVQAVSGKETLALMEEKAESKPFQLICLDWNMPGMKGSEVIKYIKKNQRITQKPKSIIISGYGEKVAEFSNHMKPDAVLIKPVKRYVLFETIMAVLGRSQNKISRPDTEKKEKNGACLSISDKKVLLVEDNIINQQVAKELLENAGLKIQIAENGKQALEAVKTWFFDLVLMDVQMPEMDGYEATREIRKYESENGLPEIPVIAMTAHAMTGEQNKCIKAGMNDYISKPIDPEKLYSVISEQLAAGSEQLKINLDKLITDNCSLFTAHCSLSEIDVKSGLNCVSGNVILYKKLLKNFAEDYADTADIIQQSLNVGNFKQIMFLVHNLKGVAGHMGAKSLHKAACEMELAIKQGRSKQYSALFDDLKNSLNKVLEAISLFKDEEGSEHIDEKDSVSTISDKNIDTSKFYIVLNKMADLINEGDSRAADYMDVIKKYLAGYGLEDQIDMLDKQIYNYDFEDARKTLAEIMKYMNSL